MIWGSMVPPLSQKVAIFYQFGSMFILKSWLFLNFLANFMSWLFDKMLALSNKKSTFVLVSGFFGCLFSQFCSNYI